MSTSREASNNQKDWHFIGKVEMDRGGDTKIYADDVWVYTEGNRAIATGNVLMAQGNNRIAAERAEFDTETRLGTFYNAWGLQSVKPQPQAPRPGAFAPPAMTGQDTVVYFFGEKIEKIGPKKYKITNGGFSTCVQPTPRWDLNAGTVILNIDHYTLLKQAVMRVKGVPVFYLPMLYYPTKREDRATGILIPTYGKSTLRGHSISNAFFWAINRSQDATIEHDWFSKTGQGVGSEYRYNMGAGDGNLRAYLLNEHAVTYETGQTSSALRSYDIRGSASQVLPSRMRARGHVNYFSSIVSSQNSNIEHLRLVQEPAVVRRQPGRRVEQLRVERLDGSQRVLLRHHQLGHLRHLAARVVDAERTADSRLGGVLFDRQRIHAHPEREQGRRGGDQHQPEPDRRGAQIRYPFKKWQWFTVNSTMSARDTYYTRSYEPTGGSSVPSKIVDLPLNRPVFSVQSQIVGPVFNRIWDTPGNGYAEKFKHTVEPFVTLDQTAPVANFDRIVPFDGIDQYVGGTRYTYGINNRFYAKRALAPGQLAQAREIFNVEISQRYYTDERASLYDRPGQIAPTVPTNFSPISLSLRGMPTNEITATVRADFDSQYRELQYISAQGTYSWTSRVQATAGWSKKAFIEENPSFNNPDFLDHSINGTGNVHTEDNRLGAIFGFNFDVLRSTITQQRLSAFYNAQCCGIAFEFQSYNFPSGSGSPIPKDRRFFLSFTLAGLGNFSPFNGAMSGVPR